MEINKKRKMHFSNSVWKIKYISLMILAMFITKYKFEFSRGIFKWLTTDDKAKWYLIV